MSLVILGFFHVKYSPSLLFSISCLTLSPQKEYLMMTLSYWLFLDDIAAKTGFMVTEKGERAFQGTFYAARFLLNERDFCFFLVRR